MHRVVAVIGFISGLALSIALAPVEAQERVIRREVAPPTNRRWACVDADGHVENVVSWDGQRSWTPPPGCTLVEITTQPGTPQPGGGWDGAAFTPESAKSRDARRERSRETAIRLQAEATAAGALAAGMTLGAERDAVLARQAALAAQAQTALAEAAR